MGFTVRLLMVVAAAWILALALGAYLIPVLRRLKAGQIIRAEGPQTHLAKAGTPTMGGLIFAIPAAMVTLVLAPRGGPGWTMTLTALAVALGHGAIGFADDYLKVVKRRSLGLRAREKMLFQTVLALGLAYVAQGVLDLGTVIRIPWTGWEWDLGPLYLPFMLFIVFATGNGVNLADGVDGLLGSVSVIVFAFYVLLCAMLGYWGMAVLAAAIAGGVAGFLHYNAYPARVFMGDAGSLFLGGALASIVILSRTELLLPVAGLIFVVETLSVILQVASFKLTGRRIFRMSPLHHHFELSGWRETTVVRRFALASLIGALAAWSGLGSWIQR